MGRSPSAGVRARPAKWGSCARGFGAPLLGKPSRSIGKRCFERSSRGSPRGCYGRSGARLVARNMSPRAPIPACPRFSLSWSAESSGKPSRSARTRKTLTDASTTAAPPTASAGRARRALRPGSCYRPRARRPRVRTTGAGDEPEGCPAQSPGQFSSDGKSPAVCRAGFPPRALTPLGSSAGPLEFLAHRAENLTPAEASAAAIERIIPSKSLDCPPWGVLARA